MRPPVVHHVHNDGAHHLTCGGNQQVRKPASTDPERVTCLKCLDRLTRP